MTDREIRKRLHEYNAGSRVAMEKRMPLLSAQKSTGFVQKTM